MAKTKEVKRLEAQQRDALRKERMTRGKAMLLLNQTVDGVVLNGNLVVYEGGEIGLPEEELQPKEERISQRNPAYEAILEKKIDEIFFLRDAKSKMDHSVYSWVKFLLGSNEQGSVRYHCDRVFF